MILDKRQANKYSDIFNKMYKIKGKRKNNQGLFSNTTFLLNDVSLPVIEQEVKGTEQFKKDVLANKPIEEQFLESYHCHNYNNSATYELNDDKRFDVKITYTTKDDKLVHSYIELKNDKVAVKTGNVAIQFYAWGRDSGIKVTMAPVWVQRVDGFYIVMRTKKLKELIRTYKPFTRWGGDSNKANNYIVPVNELVTIAEAIIVDDYYSF